MPRLIRTTLLVCVSLVVSLSCSTAALGNTPASGGEVLEVAAQRECLGCDPDEKQSSGAVYRICMPLFWNRDLVVYAHGYVSPTRPVEIPEDQMKLEDGTSISDFVTLMGYAFATTSYSTNGLAVTEAITDLLDLVDIFTAQKGEPNRVFLVGVSEGGLITALAVERHPDVFDGGMALCGPYGDFVRQTNTFSDFRAVFDYFFPGLMPGSPIDIPQSLMDDWDTHWATVVQPAIADPANASLVDQLLRATRASYDPDDFSTKEQTIYTLLWYNVFATNDGKDKLGGQPSDNQEQVYTGSNDDAHLNEGVLRFSADQAALDEIANKYQTTGKLQAPLVTSHTTGDPLVPYWHAMLYRGKTIAADNIALHHHVPVERYGHCKFEALEVLAAFNKMVAMVNYPLPYQPVNLLFLPLSLRAK